MLSHIKKLVSQKSSSDDKTIELLKLIEPYFDRGFYLSTNQDVLAHNVNPLRHYFTHGWREGRNPSKTFDTNFYINMYLKDSGYTDCPLLHYAQLPEKNIFTNGAEFFSHQNLTSEALLAQNFPMLLKLIGLRPDAVDDLIANVSLNRYLLLMFSADAYRSAKPDFASLSNSELLIRYIAFDFLNGMSPGPLFNGAFYAAQLSAHDLPPLEREKPAFAHWLKYGVRRRVSPTPLYSDEAYLSLNKDLVTYPGWLFDHFLEHGLKEERQFMPRGRISSTQIRRIDNYVSQQLNFLERFSVSEAGLSQLGAMGWFLKSGILADILKQAHQIEPELKVTVDDAPEFLPPWHEGIYGDFKTILDRVPQRHYDAIIFMPFCKLGGADFVAGVLASSLHSAGTKLLIVRTDQSEWARPDWFPDVDNVDLSGLLQQLPLETRTRLLYGLIQTLKPKSIFNVNSWLCFQLLERYAARISYFTDTFVYYFCMDQNAKGENVGYPVWHFSNIFPYLRAALLDNQNLAGYLRRRYEMGEEMASRLKVLYTPSMLPEFDAPIVIDQVKSKSRRIKPRLLWAGRLDRQKRFDMLVEIAGKMPDVEFLFWGRAVLDAAPDLGSLPKNLIAKGTFDSFHELPLRDSDGWIYTSAWDGLPTILIECAAMGMPVVASAVGGVPELITSETGWPVADAETADAYVVAIREMLDDAAERVRRASRLHDIAQQRHAREIYTSHVLDLIA
jgi:glycosyltransferase involved in cell wall biosynthesis